MKDRRMGVSRDEVERRLEIFREVASRLDINALTEDLRALAEVYARADSKGKLARDFVAAWNRVRSAWGGSRGASRSGDEPAPGGRAAGERPAEGPFREVAAVATMAPHPPSDTSQGFLFGRITTLDGATYEERLRWGGVKRRSGATVPAAPRPGTPGRPRSRPIGCRASGTPSRSSGSRSPDGRCR